MSAPDEAGPESSRGVTRPDAGERHSTRARVMAAVVLVVLVGIPALAFRQFLLVPATDVPPGRPVTVEVPAGAGTTQIADLLAASGVIDNATMFRLRARVLGIDGTLKSGAYEFETGMSYEAVEARLVAGPPLAYTTVTIPEGFTAEQIGARLERDAGIPADEFVALALGGADRFAGEHPYLGDAYAGSLEGYLFPKTYRIVDGATAAEVIELMLDQFDREFASIERSDPPASTLSTGEFVTLASMIEREARLAEERPLVASVIYNRLAAGMRLQVDATIEYVIKADRPRLLERDLAVESPYNTYRNAGLPPGPIASPGLASLRAAAVPSDTDYLYYVLTGTDGSHTFTVTYEEFLQAKERSREVTP